VILEIPPHPGFTQNAQLTIEKETQVERKPRKSVAFSEGTTIVDENGDITMKEDSHDDTTTALSHSQSTPTFSHALNPLLILFKATMMRLPSLSKMKMISIIC
jgi:hypothetical protein